MEKLELPKDIKDKILSTCVNKELCLEAMKYVYLVKKNDGTLDVAEEFENTDYHALWFVVLSVVNKAKRLLNGESIEDI